MTGANATGRAGFSRDIIRWSIVSFLSIAAVVSVVFVLAVRESSRLAVERRLVIAADTLTSRLLSVVVGDLALVKKAADSETIQRYMLDPSDKPRTQRAMTELRSFERQFQNKYVFWISDVDKMFHATGHQPYLVDPDDPVNYWYNLTLHQTEQYNFNINYNPDLRETYLWVNIPVLTETWGLKRRPIGMLGASIDLTSFSDYLSEVYRETEPGMSFFFFNAAGEVTVGPDPKLALDKVRLDVALGAAGAEIRRRVAAGEIEPGGKSFFSLERYTYMVAAIPEMSWYLTCRYPSPSVLSFNSTLNLSFLGLLAALGLALLVMNLHIARADRVITAQTENLREAAARAEAASEAKSVFLARMSHEIRTPMNAILGMSELILRAETSPAVREDAASIKRAGANLLLIINDILDFSKVESGQMALAVQDYWLPSLLQDAVSIVRVRLADRPIDLLVAADPVLPSRLEGDETRVRQILTNLLGNAEKYTVEGRISLTVSGRPADEGLLELIFQVEDTGPGIKAEELGGLFREFTQVQSEDGRRVEGTGLGLAITRRLCRLMGGEVTATSVYGEGSVFTARITQKILEGPYLGDWSVWQDQDRLIRRADLSFIAPEARLLVVDDVAVNLKVANGLLAPYRAAVELCQSGREAVELVRSKNYDLVFMDHMMPGMDGVEATRAIRDLSGEKYRSLPIVALTANAVSGMRERLLASGFSDFISKPIDVNRLEESLKRWLPAGKLRPAPAPSNEAKAWGTASAGPALVKPDLDLPGVDVAAGLARVGGSPEIYRDLLAMLRLDAGEALGFVAAPPSGETLKPFVVAVHGLKSALANVGAAALSRAAGELEAAGAAGDLAAVGDRLESFRAGLLGLLEAIEAALPPPEASGAAEEGGAPVPAAELAELRRALAAGDIEAIDAALARLEAGAPAGRARALVAEIADCVLTADFQKAAEIAAGLG
ncbi:hypothetical protein FACS189460_1380 [Deltaproteobacteria bacterium]|nr:hypothetical protein FACS189460_1380 [Deltaproteobacteria bacterium]